MWNISLSYVGKRGGREGGREGVLTGQVLFTLNSRGGGVELALDLMGSVYSPVLFRTQCNTDILHQDRGRRQDNVG